MLFILVPLVLICQKSIYGKVINSLIGPYCSHVERFYNCESDNHLLPWEWHLRPSHFNPHKPKEIQLITGNMTGVNVSFDNSNWGKVILDSRSNNQWKENSFVFHYRRNACQALRSNIPNFFEQIFKRGDDKGACIVKPGVYTVNNTPVDWTYPNIPIFPYGQYRFRMMFGKGENQHACLVAECQVLPKLPD